MSTHKKHFCRKRKPGSRKTDWKEYVVVALFFISLVSLSLLTQN